MMRNTFQASANPNVESDGMLPGSPATDTASPLNLIGRDVAHVRGRAGVPLRLTVLLMVIFAVAGLGIVGMRSDVMRIRYALSEAITEEKRLRLEYNESTVEMRKLRSPARVTRLAEELGFQRPERIIDLSVPTATLAQDETIRGNP